MSMIDKPGRWRLVGWGDERWFDAYYRDRMFWRGLDQSGKYAGWRGESNGWTYLGPLPGTEPISEPTDEQKVQWFRELVQAGRVRYLRHDGSWIQLQPQDDHKFQLIPQLRTVTITGPDAAIDAAKQTPGVEVVSE